MDNFKIVKTSKSTTYRKKDTVGGKVLTRGILTSILISNIPLPFSTRALGPFPITDGVFLWGLYVLSSCAHFIIH